MKKPLNNRSYRQFLYIFPLFTLIGSVYGMKRLNEEPSKATPSMKIEKPARTKKLKNIWIKTSDNKLITMPEWQVDQVKVLQLLLAHQKGTNNRHKPINLLELKKNNETIVDASKNALNLIKIALEVSQDPQEVSSLWSLMTPQEYNILLNNAANLEANTLYAALASIHLPQDMQSRINLRIINPILDYFIKGLAIAIASPESPHNAHPVPFAPFVKISPNGRYFLSNDRYDGRSSLLWDLATKQIIRDYDLGPIKSINFSSKGDYIIIYRGKNNYVIYDYTSKTVAFGLQNSNNITFNPDDTCCLFNSPKTGTINVKSRKTTQQWINLPTTLQGHSAQVNTIQFSPDGNYIVSGSDDDYPNNLILWDGNSFEKIKSLSYEGPWTAHIYPVTQAHFTPDSKYIISTDKQQYTIVWDVASKKPITKLDLHNKVLWKAESEQSTKLTIDLPKFTYNPHYLHTYVTTNQNSKGLYEFMTNTIFNYPVLPINENAMSTLTTDLNYHKIIGEQFFSMPPFDRKKEAWAIPNNNNNTLQDAVESSNSQYLLLSYLPEKITLRFADTKNLLFIPVKPYEIVRFSPENDYIIITHPPTVPRNRMFTIWTMNDLKMMRDACYTEITLAQSRFLYRLYLALMNGVKVMINQNDSDYEVYKSLPENIRSLVDRFLPFEIIQKA